MSMVELFLGSGSKIIPRIIYEYSFEGRFWRSFLNLYKVIFNIYGQTRPTAKPRNISLNVDLI